MPSSHLPLIAVQALWLRATVKLAPPASGPAEGVAGPAGPSEPIENREERREPLRIAVVGDSTAAGCGVAEHRDGFAAQLARELAARAGRPVEWRTIGQFGATSRRVRFRLLPELEQALELNRNGARASTQGLDAAVLLAGGNDVMSRRTPEQWREDATAIVQRLGELARRVVVVGIPPFALFPSVPRTLGRYLAARAAALDEVSQEICWAQPHATWVTTVPGTPAADFFAADRFHPSASGYRTWAQFVAGYVQLPLSRQPSPEPSPQ